MKERYINNKIFWEIVEELGWGKSYDKKLLGKKLVYFILDIDEIQELKRIAIKKRETLDDVLKAYQYDGYEIQRYWGGDDSYWDFRAHIVGLGEKIYNSCITDISNISIAGNYKENFEYIFRHAQDFAETDEGKKLLKMSLKDRKIMYYRKMKIDNINKK